MLRLVTLGHVTLDRIKTGRHRKTGWIPGGPAVHTSLTATSLRARPHITSKVGTDFGQRRIRWLRQKGVDTRFLTVAKAPTTKFEITYQNDRRRLRLLGRCDNLETLDLEQEIRIHCLHIAPVIGEIPETVAGWFADRSMLVSLDPQGYLRKVGRNKLISERRWLDRSLLKKIGILKATSDELRAMIGDNDSNALKRLKRMGPPICIHTRGSEGLDLLIPSGFFHIPAYRPEKVVDPTGAGDVFTAAFLLDFSRSGDAVWSACLGTAAASLKIEHMGPGSIREPSKISERANELLSNVRRISEF